MNPIDDRAIERRLLELAYTTEVKLTVPALAFFAPCSIADASRVLDDLAARDQLDMDIQDDGSVVYQLRGRERIALPSGPTTPSLAPSVDVHRRSEALARHPHPVLAAFLSLIVPGAGHLYAGRFLAAFAWFFVVTVAYVLIIPGLILHLISIGSAAAAASRTLASANHQPRLLRAA